MRLLLNAHPASSCKVLLASTLLGPVVHLWPGGDSFFEDPAHRGGEEK